MTDQTDTQSLPSTMTALRAHQRGGPEQLVVEEAPRPEPASGETLVDVHAAAITFTELNWDETWTRNGQDRTPVIVSHEFSGVVASLGPDQPQDGPAVGDPVFGLVPFDRDGAAAHYVVVPTSNIAIKPEGLSHVEASSLPLAAATAWQSLVTHAHVQPGEQVLILGGAGAVGNFAVQIALDLGAEVTTTVLHSHLPYVRGLGATRVVDADDEGWEDLDPGFDVVIDTVGGDTLIRSFKLLRPGGRLVTLMGPPDPHLAAAHQVDATFFIVRADPDALREIADLADSKRLDIEIAATFPLAEGPAAYKSGATTPRPPGKTVLIVSS